MLYTISKILSKDGGMEVGGILNFFVWFPGVRSAQTLPSTATGAYMTMAVTTTPCPARPTSSQAEV